MKLRTRGIRRPDRHAREWALHGYLAPGAQTNGIRHIDAYPPDTTFVPMLRVSTDNQDIGSQRYGCEVALKTHGGTLLEFCTDGYLGRARLDGDGDYVCYLRAVSEFARDNNAVLLATTRNRLIRPYNKRGRPKKRPPSATELRLLSGIGGNVPMATLIDPDSPPSAERSFQTRLGQAYKGKKGGRPAKKKPGYKKRRRESLLPQVEQLLREGMSYRGIAERLEIDDRTVRRWVRRFLHDELTS
ncbi:MAG: helix-turn-helix domain-containing protein [Pseudomonadaceae bacterium]|nr:helix-turn-helix domain-containing protein [Pseudomonadaceae bacterium]